MVNVNGPNPHGALARNSTIGVWLDLAAVLHLEIACKYYRNIYPAENLNFNILGGLVEVQSMQY